MGPDDPTKKYHQIVVPEHALKADTSGTSFLRMGTFPSLTDPTKHPPGFQNSLALAKLAGDHHLKTGGSWHHVDGNRVETTTGRKVEVIAGSYVAHRGPGNSPGPNFSATWATNSYTQVGSRDVPVGWNPNVTPPAAPTTTPDKPAANFVETLSFGYDGSTTGTDPSSRIETTPTSSNSRLLSGDVVGVTWAQRIMTYVGSISAPVPLVYAETWATTSYAYSYFSAAGYTYVGTPDFTVPIVYAETHAGTLGNKTFANGDITTWNHSAQGTVWQDTMVGTAILTTQEAAADISVFNTAPILTTVNTGALQATLNVGAVLATLNLALDLIGSFNIGINLTINMPSSVTFTGDETGVKLASEDMNAAQTQINGIRTRLEATANHLVTVSNAIAGTQTSLAATRTALGTISHDLHAMSNLGG